MSMIMKFHCRSRFRAQQMACQRLSRSGLLGRRSGDVGLWHAPVWPDRPAEESAAVLAVDDALACELATGDYVHESVDGGGEPIADSGVRCPLPQAGDRGVLGFFIAPAEEEDRLAPGVRGVLDHLQGRVAVGAGLGLAADDPVEGAVGELGCELGELF